LNTVTRFLADIHAKSQKFRDFAVSSNYVQELLVVLYPVVVSSEIVSAELEIDSRESLALNFNGSDLEQPSLTIIKTTTVTPSTPDKPSSSLRRGSSFILVTSDKTPHTPSTARLHHIVLPKSSGLALNISNSVVQGLLEIVIAVFQDQILTRKDFSGLGLFLKVPPGFLEHQAFFESWLLRNTLSSLGNTLMLNQNLLQEPRVLTNLARFVTHIGEAIYEGWFIGGADALLDFAGVVLEHLQRSDIARLKSTRLCSQPIAIIRNTLFRTMLLRLSEVDANEASSFLEKLTFWQTILLSSEATDDGQSEHLQLVCYLLYARLVSSQPHVRMLSADLWRIVLVQKPEEAASILNHARTQHQRNLSSGFQKIVELDNETFLYWIDEHREQLDAFFFGAMSKTWESFVQEENLHTEQTTSERLSRRKERLQQWHLEEMAKEDAVRRHDVSFGHWASNIYTSEHLKHQRTIQDQNDAITFVLASFTKLTRELRRPNGLLHDAGPAKWRLDQTEGRNRMRLRIVPDDEERQDDYQPKRRGTETPLKLDTRIRALTASESVGVTPSAMTQNVPDLPQAILKGDSMELDDSFEMIEEPNDEDGYEDKNRKVMRSLNRGDQVQHVTNISRIVGLEACEGLLILGKDSLYLLDNFFQRADGEIVNVWQAPQDERDPYVRMIAGRESTEKRANTSSEHETRSWKWEEIISVSKRRFLFRNVGLEVFFTDGRSYLLTLISPLLRNELHSQILSRAPQINGGPSLAQPEDIWRFETLKSPDDAPQTLGSKFANVFNQSSSNPATRKWMKGEISNFHYLMLINTMAGRTFNDLTQYPVFPWILADYISEELDLTNPKTFRDLSKPMGCQTTEREAEFRDRYQSFAEMGDHNSPPFHYGTHYSSAMIVASYLIRLQPFVQSYLLLQGGSFDHPDRLFYSIANAWDSASRVNMTDVRELTPEFFYLPEFLVNSNKYNFGVRQGDQTIDTVALPPWAKGDPKIFIAKHREALESPYVSKNLHRWIDLVFGYKQKGDAAFDAVNVFHHLSYQGAKDLDNIDDPVERLATIGIIHNFGQTPHQVFQRAHPQREAMGHKYKRLDTAVQSLARLPVCLLGTVSIPRFRVYLTSNTESHERVASLLFSWKQERLLCSAAFRLNIPPNYDKYMEWGFADGSVRFYSADSRKVGVRSPLHIIILIIVVDRSF
jgi:beige protein homolog 1